MAANRLRKLARSCNNDPEKLVSLISNFTFKQSIIGKNWVMDIQLYQVKTEITSLCEIVQKANPHVIVEIGTSSGGTLFLFSNITQAKKIVSIDLPNGPFGGCYPSWKIPLFKSFSKWNTIKLLRADSHSEETALKLRRILNGSKIDFLFIDGDHTYDGVKKDFEIYSPLVKEGGIIAFHDIAQHDPVSGCHVDDFGVK
ncbi:MAG: class I SAM-dependent methyltransferase [Candidatus Bathyarchaeota archaeon]|nr:class I SAM-dependent methyltransferase [Candidatus Bathyarchaeota archaeon]